MILSTIKRCLKRPSESERKETQLSLPEVPTVFFFLFITLITDEDELCPDLAFDYYSQDAAHDVSSVLPLTLFLGQFLASKSASCNTGLHDECHICMYDG